MHSLVVTLRQLFITDTMKFANIFEERKNLQNAESVDENEQIIVDAGLKYSLALYSAPKNNKDLNELKSVHLLKQLLRKSCLQFYLPP